MINPTIVMKLLQAKKQFQSNHPKFFSFFNVVGQNGIPEKTVIEITVTKPGTNPLTTNIKVRQSDLEMFDCLYELIKNN